MEKLYNNKYFKFFSRFFVFIFILWVLDFFIGTLLKNYYEKQKSGLLYRTTYSLDSTKADILIFGASRANHHYVPSIFKKKLNMSCYNTGRDGQIIFYNDAVLRSVLKRYTPKIVILDFERREFSNDDDNSYDRLSALLPYYNSHPEIRPILKLKGPYEKIKRFSKIYTYNSLIFTILVGASNYNKTREYIKDYNGYVPLPEIWHHSPYIDSTRNNYRLDTNKINIYKSFVKECANSGVKLYIFLSPVCVKYYYNDKSVMIAKRIAEKYNTPVYDYTNNPFFLNRDTLFADGGHLNQQGAKIFTKKVVNQISSDLYASEKTNIMLSEK
jgi:hypothetical protein